MNVLRDPPFKGRLLQICYSRGPLCPGAKKKAVAAKPPLSPKLILATLFAALTAIPTPAELADGLVSPVRRTTIATADPEASLRFYRDLLGFTVEYDIEVTDPNQLALFDAEATRGRAIALKQDTLAGSIGLFWSPSLRAEPCGGRAKTGAVALLLLTKQLDALEERMREAGVPFLSSPRTYAASRGETRALTVLDPNCVRVAVAEIVDEPLEESLAR